jgi:hypothetical protein
MATYRKYASIVTHVIYKNNLHFIQTQNEINFSWCGNNKREKIIAVRTHVE